MHNGTCYANFYTLSNILKQREKCVRAATAFIEEGTSLVVGKLLRNCPAFSTWLCILICILKFPDNTNADQDVRAVWVNLAKKHAIPIRCVLFTASAKLCEHNDTFRALNLGSDVSFQP